MAQSVVKDDNSSLHRYRVDFARYKIYVEM